MVFIPLKTKTSQHKVHKKGEMVSVSEAARALGVSRRTIQRKIKEGKLKKNSGVQFGRGAAQLDLDEVRRICVNERTKHGVYPSELQPSFWRAIRKFLEDQGFNPIEVIKVLIKAALSDHADIDFFLYCVERLRMGDEVFVGLVMGIEYPPSWADSDPARKYAAERVKSFFVDFEASNDHDADTEESKRTESLDTVDRDFCKLWEIFVNVCIHLPVNAEVNFYYDTVTKEADILLTPLWLPPDIPGLLPIEGGKYSATHRGRISDPEAVHSIATKLHANIERGWGLETEEGVNVFNDFIDLLSDSSLTNLPSDGKRPAERKILDRACNKVGLSRREFQILSRAWHIIKGDVMSKSSKEYDDRKDYTDITDKWGKTRVSATRLAKILGVSRQTASRYIAKYRR